MCVFKIGLLCKKGVFCYDYFNSPDRLSEPALPSKDKFFNNLYQSDISKEDYQHALNVWEKFECKTFADYIRIYNISDVLILADVFENFRNLAHTSYHLEPLQYYSMPGLSWDAALKFTGENIELIKDMDMYMINAKIMGLNLKNYFDLQ